MADRTVKVTLKGDISDYNRAMLAASAGTKTFAQSLDTSTDRMQNLVQTSLALGPALVPIGAAAVPVITGLSNQLAFAAAGAGVAALAFGGVGDALKATNDYAVEPSTANLEKMSQALAELGPAGRQFVGFLQELRPQLQGLQTAAQEGLFPGMEAGITDLMRLLPQAERIVSTIAESMGTLIAEAGSNLNNASWVEFFTFLENEARPTLLDMGRTLGNFAEGFANLWMAFDPVSDSFSASFLQMSRDFAAWTDGLSETQGFQEFVDYINTNGPRAWDALTALGNALLQIVEAAAPVGSAVLPVITILADTLAAVANSPVGPVLIGAAAGISAISRAIALYNVANGSAMFGALNNMAGVGPRLKAAGVGIGLLALSLTDLDESMGVSNTANMAVMGAFFGPWGAAAGAAAGAIKDLQAANEGLAGAVRDANAAIASGNLEALTRAAADLNMELAKVDGDGGNFGQKIIDQSEKLTHGFGAIFGGVAEQVIDKYTTSAEEARAAVEPLEAAQKKAARAAEDQAFEEAGLGLAMANASQDARDETLALLENIRTKNQAADAAENAFSAETNYRQALKDAQAQAKENNAGIDGMSDAALKNRGALDTLASAWNRVADAGQASAGDMKKAKANFVDAAVGMGVSKKAAQALADELFHIPSPKPKVTLTGAEKAKIAAWNVKRAIDAIHGKSVNVTVNHIDKFFKQRFADGGEVHGPGGPRGDKIPAMLSDGEFVVNAASAQRNLGLLHQLNAQKFADGGPVAQRMASPDYLSPFASMAAQGGPVGPSDAQIERAVAKGMNGATLKIATDGRSLQLKTRGA